MEEKIKRSKVEDIFVLSPQSELDTVRKTGQQRVRLKLPQIWKEKQKEAEEEDEKIESKIKRTGEKKKDEGTW